MFRWYLFLEYPRHKVRDLRSTVLRGEFPTIIVLPGTANAEFHPESKYGLRKHF